MHLPGFAAVRGCKLVAIADVNRKLAGEMGERFGIKSVFKDYRKMLKMDGLDAVSVCTPNFLHCPMCVDSSRAGKHVMVEKPIATSMKEVRKMVAAAKKARKILMVEQPQRFRPAHETAQELLAKKVVGKVNHVIGRFGHGGPEGWAPDSKWFFDAKRAFGGAMADLGIHLIDLMRFLVPTPITEVCGMTATMQRKMKLEDLGALTFRYADGSLGQAAASWCLKPGGMRIEVSGSKGVLVLDHGEVTVYAVQKGIWRPKVTKPKIRAKSKLGGPWKHFVDCCRRGRKPMIDGVEGGKSLEVLVAGFRSQKTGRHVRLPLR
jgi:predicted dehydrogenase